MCALGFYGETLSKEVIGLVDRWIILKCILKKYKGRSGLHSVGFGFGTSEGLL